MSWLSMGDFDRDKAFVDAKYAKQACGEQFKRDLDYAGTIPNATARQMLNDAAWERQRACMEAPMSVISMQLQENDAQARASGAAAPNPVWSVAERRWRYPGSQVEAEAIRRADVDAAYAKLQPVVPGVDAAYAKLQPVVPGGIAYGRVEPWYVEAAKRYWKPVVAVAGLLAIGKIAARSV